jgi:hypothetical protein
MKPLWLGYTIRIAITSRRLADYSALRSFVCRLYISIHYPLLVSSENLVGQERNVGQSLNTLASL